MRCPYCQHENSRVIESRTSDDHTSVRRRRECENKDCTRRFTTYEKVEMAPLVVVKKDRKREEFARDKLLRGMIRACEKRPISIEMLEASVDRIEREVRTDYDREVPSTVLGEKVMSELFTLDGVAYVRFASVYRQFRDVETFAKEVLALVRVETNGAEKVGKQNNADDFGGKHDEK